MYHPPVTLAALSLAALVIALAVSCVSQLNIGVLAIVLAWLVGVYAGGMRVEQVLAGFPVSLFVTLVGVTLLFAQAQANGTLEQLARRAVQLCRGIPGLIPIMFFVFTAALSSSGPGNIAATALMAPVGMAAAGRFKIPPFLMAIMIANGASAGSVSPIAPTGVIVNQLVAKLGLPDARWTIYANNLIAHAAVARAGYFLFGGLVLLRRGVRPAAPVAAYGAAGRGSANQPMVGGLPDQSLHPERAIGEPSANSSHSAMHFGWQHRLTIAVIAALI